MIEEDSYLPYFQIDRDLNSTNINELTIALNKLQEILPNIKSKLLLNTIMLKLIKMLSQTNLFYIKHKIHLILSKFYYLMQDLANKQQISNSLSSQLHASDKVTRIISLKVIRNLSFLFKKEVSSYHLILSKLKSEYQIERKQAYFCLKNILKDSSYLSQIFCKNLDEIIGMNISLISIINISYYLKINEISFTNIIKLIWKQICQNQTKKRVHHFMRLLIKHVSVNNKIAQYYLTQIKNNLIERDNNNFKKEVEDVVKMIKARYNFLVNEDDMEIQQNIKISNKNIIHHHYQIFKQKNSNIDRYYYIQQHICQLLDFLYEEKNRGSILKQYQYFINDVIMLYITANNQNGIIKEILLLCYYSQNNFDKELIKKYIASQQYFTANINIAITHLKILIVLKYYECSNRIILKLLNQKLGHKYYRRILYYKAIVNTFISINTQKFEDLQQFASYRKNDDVDNQQYFENILVKYFAQYYFLVSRVQNNQSDLSLKITQLNEIILRLNLIYQSLYKKYYKKYQKQLEYLRQYLGLIQKIICMILINEEINVQKLIADIRKYIPEWVANGITNCRQLLLSGIYFSKISLINIK